MACVRKTAAHFAGICKDSSLFAGDLFFKFNMRLV